MFFNIITMIYIDGSRGCEDKWDCCEQAPEEQGCITVCDRCGVRWGHKPGCCWPEVDDDTKSPDVDEDGNVIDEMKTNDYDEEHNPALAEEMAEERKAAIEAELTPVPPMGYIPTNSERDATNMSNDELL